MDEYFHYRRWARQAAECWWQKQSPGEYGEFDCFTKANRRAIDLDYAREVLATVDETDAESREDFPTLDQLGFNFPVVDGIRFCHLQQVLNFFGLLERVVHLPDEFDLEEFREIFGTTVGAQVWEDRQRLVDQFRPVALTVLRNLLTVALSSYEPRTRAGVWLYVGHYQYQAWFPEVVDLLKFSLSDPDARLVQTALMVLTRFTPELLKACKETVIALSEHSDEVLRNQATKTLGEYLDCPDQDVRLAAERRLSDEDSTIRFNALITVGVLRKRSKPLLSMAKRRKGEESLQFHLGALLDLEPAALLEELNRSPRIMKNASVLWRIDVEEIVRIGLFQRLCGANDVSTFGNESGVVLALAESFLRYEKPPGAAAIHKR